MEVELDEGDIRLTVEKHRVGTKCLPNEAPRFGDRVVFDDDDDDLDSVLLSITKFRSAWVAEEPSSKNSNRWEKNHEQTERIRNLCCCDYQRELPLIKYVLVFRAAGCDEQSLQISSDYAHWVTSDEYLKSYLALVL